MVWILAFFICIALLFLLPLAPAFIEWYGRSDALPLKVVKEYDGNIRYFAQRFRQFLDEHAPGLSEGRLSPAFASQGRLESDEYQLVANWKMPTFNALELQTETTSRMIFGTGSLRLPDEMFFEKEIYAFGQVQSGNHNSFRALLADGAITLGVACDVVRWAHSNASLSVGERNRLYGRISAEEQIHLQRDTRFVRMHAPTIRFGAIELTRHPHQIPVMRPLSEPKSLLDRTGERWLIASAFKIPPASSHAGSIVAKGALNVGRDSDIDGGLKSSDTVHLEANVSVSGSIVAEGDIYIGPGCRIAGPVVSDGKVTIATGCVIGSHDLPTTITAHEIRVEEGVQTHGSVWARELGFVAQVSH